MNDLAAILHYKSHFTVRLTDESTTLHGEIVTIVRQWMLKKYGFRVHSWDWAQFAEGGEFIATDRCVQANVSRSGDGDDLLWSCIIDEIWQPRREPFAQDESRFPMRVPRTWQTEIYFHQIAPTIATVSLIVCYINQNTFLGERSPDPEPTTPGLVYRILNRRCFECSMEGSRLSTEPIALEPGSANDFADFLLNPSRGVPVVLMIPDYTESEENVQHILNVAPDELMRALVGNAQVYYATSTAYYEELSYFLRKAYWCKPGGIRIYWPHIESDGELGAQRHTFLSARQIAQMGEGETILSFRRVLSQSLRKNDSIAAARSHHSGNMLGYDKSTDSSDVSPDHTSSGSTVLADNYRLHADHIENPEALTDEERYKAQIEAMREELEIRDLHVKSASDLLEQTANEVIDLREQNKSLTDNYANLQRDFDDRGLEIEIRDEEIDSRDRRIRELENSLKEINRHVGPSRSAGDQLHALREMAFMPNTPQAVVRFFSVVYSDRIAFTERAMRELSDCETNAETVWQCLYHMANTLCDLHRAGTPLIDQEFRRITGWDLGRGEGSQTRKDPKLMRLRKDTFMGREIDIEPHIKRGTRESAPDFIRAYYCFDESTSLIVVGHLGSHLDNFTTRRR